FHGFLDGAAGLRALARGFFGSFFDGFLGRFFGGTACGSGLTTGLLHALFCGLFLLHDFLGSLLRRALGSSLAHGFLRRLTPGFLTSSHVVSLSMVNGSAGRDATALLP